MREDLQELLDRIKANGPYKLTREEAISFVYGNCVLANPNVTREMVEKAYDARKQADR